jgi:cytochrome c peroxidase
MQLGCSNCHTGDSVGGKRFQKFGLMEDYWKETGSKVVDKGRFDVTHDEADLYVFKVPILRKVAMTPPILGCHGRKILSTCLRIADVDTQVNSMIAQIEIIRVEVNGNEGLFGRRPSQRVSKIWMVSKAIQALWRPLEALAPTLLQRHS